MNKQKEINKNSHFRSSYHCYRVVAIVVSWKESDESFVEEDLSPSQFFLEGFHWFAYVGLDQSYFQLCFFWNCNPMVVAEEEEDPLQVEAIGKGRVRVAIWLEFVLVRLGENEDNGFQFYIGSRVDGVENTLLSQHWTKT